MNNNNNDPSVFMSMFFSLFLAFFLVGLCFCFRYSCLCTRHVYSPAVIKNNWPAGASSEQLTGLQSRGRVQFFSPSFFGCRRLKKGGNSC